MAMKRVEARVIRSVGDYHTVMLPRGEQLICRTRGRVRWDFRLLPGDVVEVSIESGEGVIEKVARRQSQLERPPIANVTQAVIVMAALRPRPSLSLLDRMLIVAEREGLSIVVVLNKMDLAVDDTLSMLGTSLKKTGYPVIGTSTKTGDGLDVLKKKLQHHLSVFAGSSGVGKSSILNQIIPGTKLKTADVSDRIERGRHTTRHVSLLPLGGGGWVADSPGFANIDLKQMDPRDLPRYYRDYMEFTDECRFSGCLHRGEPGCQIKQMVEDGMLDADRYERYLTILQEVSDAFERRFD